MKNARTKTDKYGAHVDDLNKVIKYTKNRGTKFKTHSTCLTQKKKKKEKSLRHITTPGNFHFKFDLPIIRSLYQLSISTAVGYHGAMKQHYKADTKKDEPIHIH